LFDHRNEEFEKYKDDVFENLQKEL